MTTQNDVLNRLSGILRDGVDIHRCAAATALGKINQPDAVGPLIEALRDEDEDVRTDVSAALLKIQDPRAATQLLENLIGDPCGEVKVAAIETLTQMKHDPVVPWLRKIVLNRDPEIVWDDDGYHADGWDDWDDLQVKAIDALAAFGCEDAVPDIVTAMQDEMGQELTDVGFRNLVKLGDPGIAAAAAALNAPNENLRRRVVRYLAQSDAPASRAALVNALKDKVADVREAAVTALAERDPASPELRALIEHPSKRMRELVVRLCGVANPDLLIAGLNDKALNVRRAVLTLVAERPDLMPAREIAKIAAKYLAGDAPKTAAAAAATLAAVDPEGAVDALAAQLADPERFIEVRLAALRNLIRLDGEKVIDGLAGCVGDSVRQIRLEALAGLSSHAAHDPAWPNSAGDILLAALNSDAEAEVPAAAEPEQVEATEEILAADAGANELPQPRTSRKDKPDTGANSTLESILGADSAELQAVKVGTDKVELSPKDLEFLGLAQRKLKKRKLDPIPMIAAPLDAKRYAARVLGDVARDGVAEALAGKIQGADIELALNALDSLVRIGGVLNEFSEPVELMLVDVLNGKDENRRLLALRALAETGSQRARHAIRVALDDGNSFLRLEAVRAAARAGEIDHQRIGAMLDDPDSTVRLAAAETLAGDADEDALDRLANFTFAFEGYHHREAARLLRRVDPVGASRRYLNVLVEDQRRREWQVAIAALGEVNEAETVIQ